MNVVNLNHNYKPWYLWWENVWAGLLGTPYRCFIIAFTETSIRIIILAYNESKPGKLLFILLHYKAKDNITFSDIS